MTRYVIDASAIVPLYFDEVHSADPEAFMASLPELHAPDLLQAETASAVWKRRRKGDISREDAAGIVDQILRMPIAIHPSAGLVAAALQLAVETDRTLYDCLYLALAVRLGTRVVSGDRRFLNALAGTPMERHVAWIGDEPA